MAQIRVLILEDRDADAQLMARELSRAGLDASWRRVETEQEYLEYLKWGPDLILADYTLPQFDALSALQALEERQPDIPFIIVSGSIGEDLAVSAMQFGAADYLLKDRLARLGPAAIRALEQRRIRQEKRRAEEALRKSEERLKLAQDAAGVGTSDWDLRTNEVAGSAVNAMLFGLDPGQPNPSYQEWLRIIHPADRSRVDDTIEAAVRRGGNIELEYRVVWPNGEVRWLFGKARVLTDEGGRAIRIIGAHTDITERKLAEEALRESEQWLKLAQRAGGIGIWELDLRTDRCRCSEERARLYGLESTGDQPDLQDWVLRVCQEDREDVRRALAEAVRSSEPYRQEFRVIWPDGSVHWLSSRAQVVFDQEGNPVRMLGAEFDITERKRGEEALARLAAIVQSSDDAIIGTTLDGCIVSWNRGAERLYGYAADEAVGRNTAMLLPPGGPNEVAHALERATRGEVVRMYDRVRLRKDGTIVYVSITISPISDAFGAVIGASLIARDMTDRKRAEEQIGRMNQELQDLSGRLIRSQDETRRSIARDLHDGVGQEFVALAMHLSLLRTSPAVSANPEAEKALGASIALAEQCSRQVRSMSYLLHPPLLDELGLASALQNFVEGFSERAGMPVELSIESEIGRLHTELETTLFRIVQEALSNIHRHSGSRTARVRLARNGTEILLDVSDEGCGIPAGLLDGSGSHVARLGVGIPGMRERARQLGGRFEIRSDTGGTSISVALPIREPNETNSHSDC
jgi:PAS domain S-box-containing protein